MTEKKLSFEESMKELEKAAAAMDRDDITLEEALKSYEKGIRYYKQCAETLENAKQKIETLKK